MSSYFKLGALIEGTETTATAGGTTTLIASSKMVQQFTGTQNQTVILPNATGLSVGRKFDILNRSTGTITVQNSGGITLGTVSANSQRSFVCKDNGSANGVFALGGNPGSAGAGASVTKKDSLLLLQGLAGSNFESDTIVSKTFKINPEEGGSNYWLSRSNMDAARSSGAVFYLNGNIYQSGGASTGGPVNNNAQRFSEQNNYWIARSTPPFSRQYNIGFALNSYGYSTGGYDGAAYSAATYQYNDSTDSWVSKANLNSARGNVQGELPVLDGKAFYPAGLGAVQFNTTEMYDDVANVWYLRGNAILTRHAHAMFAYNGAIYIGAGETQGGIQWASTVEKYDLDKNTYSSAASITTARAYPGSSVSGLGAQIWGGTTNGTNQITTNEEFNDTSGSWITRAPLTTGVLFPQGSSAKGSGYQIGGGPSGSVVGVVNSYRPFSFITLKLKSSLAAPTSILVATKLSNKITSLAVQLRSDDNTWKTLEANKDKAIETGETLKDKFREVPSIYAHGGNVSSTERFNDATNTWVNRVSLSTSKYTSGAFNLNGLGYVVGGSFSTKTNDQINDTTNSYVTKAPTINDHNTSPAAFVLESLGYIAAGTNATVEAYNDSTNTWSAKASVNAMPDYVQNGSFMVSGRGYLYCGVNGSFNITQRYDALLNTWTTTGATVSPARGAVGSFGLNNYGFICGGWSGALNSAVSRYDNETNAYASRANMANAVEWGQGGTLGGYGYCFGGDTNPTALTRNEQFNDEANIWTTKGSLNTARTGNGANAVGPNPYRNYEIKVGIPSFIAGLGAGIWLSKTASIYTTKNAEAFTVGGFGISPGASEATGVERYNHVNDSWKATGPTLGNKSYSLSFSLLGFGYMAGGNPANTTAEKFNPDTEAWSSIAPMVASVRGLTTGDQLNGFGYAVGGDTNPGSTATAEKYDPQANTWTAVASMAIAGLSQGSAASVLGFLYVKHTTSGGVAQAAGFEKYNDSANIWTTMANRNNAVDYSNSMVIKNKLFLVGGTGPTDIMEEYLTSINIWLNRSNSGLTGVTPAFVVENKGVINNGTTKMYASNLNDIVLGIALEVK